MHMCGVLCCVDNASEAFVHSYWSEWEFKSSCVCGYDSMVRTRRDELQAYQDPSSDTVDYSTCVDYTQYVGNETFYHLFH